MHQSATPHFECLRPWHLPRTWRSAIILFFGIVIAFNPNQSACAAEGSNSIHVLLLFENGRLLPANVQADKGFNDVISGANTGTVVSAEFLDAPRFQGEAYTHNVLKFLREKYRSQPPDVIVAGGNGAVDFLLKNRSEFFPSAPVVYMGVEKSFLDGMLRPLPSDVVGVPVEFDFSGTIEQALKWHPRSTRLVVVTGTSPPDREFERQVREITKRFEPQLVIEHLAGLPTPQVLKRLAELDSRSVIFTPGYFEDGDGRTSTPRAAVGEMAANAAAPVYGPFNTFIGAGIVGGRMPNFEAMGREAGGEVVGLINGTAPADLKLPATMPSTLNVDWRQVRRWGIADDMPPGTIVHFRTPTFWETYHTEAIIALALFLLQSALVAGLLFERRRRRGAEVSVDHHRFQLAHASRLAMAGELTASIAHEINQPLGAVLSNVSAAEIILGRGTDGLEEVRQILGDIHRDNIRASEVVNRLRALLAKHEVHHDLVDLNESLADMMTILRGEAQRRRTTLTIRPAVPAVEVYADRIQVQQILLNLTLNAMDAVSDEADHRRTIVVTAERRDNRAAITVSDHGHGISQDHLARLFDSFFSTKRTGIGLGLSIVRTLVEAHGGRVWAANAPEGGAIFQVEFPLARQSSLEMPDTA